MEAIKSYYPNGKLICEGFLNDKVQVGDWTFYYKNGSVFSKGRFDNSGVPTGIWKEFYESGKIKYEAISSQGNSLSLRDDDLKILNYWKKDGTQLVIKGKGILTTYFDNGNIKHTSHWQDNLKNGILKEFYESGSFKSEKTYKDGVSDGEGKLLFENGNIACKYFYQKGKPIGEWNEWYENGQKMEEGEYVDNEYLITNFWTEDGLQTLKEGKGKTIRKEGTADIYEQHYEGGKMLSEKRI